MKGGFHVAINRSALVKGIWGTAGESKSVYIT